MASSVATTRVLFLGSHASDLEGPEGRPQMGGNDAVKAWLRDQARQNLSAGTIEKRESAARRMSAHAGKPLIHVTRDEIEAWLDSRPKLAPRTRYSEISHLATFFRWAIREGLTDFDPTVRVTRPKVRLGLPRPVATPDLRYAIDQAVNDPELSAILHLAAFEGMRCMEISQLEVEQVCTHHEPPVIVVHGKGGKDRIVPLHSDVLAALRRHGMPMRGPVFPRRNQPWKVSAKLRRHLINCGVAASGHQLRHWFATSTYEASGGDLRLVQELLGHSSPSTTAIYTKWSQVKAASVVSQLSA